MFIFTVLLLGSLDQVLGDPRPCTREDFCINVPDGTCNKSQCQPIKMDQFAEFGRSGFRVLTYAIGQKVFLGYCPLTFELDESQTYEGTASATVHFAVNSGPFCNISKTTNKIISYRTDPYTGVTDSEILSLVQAGDNYEKCFVYFDPGVAFVYRICRVDPTPELGQECATFYVVVATNADSNRRDKLDKFLKNSGIDFKEIEVDCL